MKKKFTIYQDGFSIVSTNFARNFDHWNLQSALTGPVGTIAILTARTSDANTSGWSTVYNFAGFVGQIKETQPATSPYSNPPSPHA
jgi:hypothetical protein